MISFTPKNRETLEKEMSESFLTPGFAKFKVMEVEEGVSKAGNDCIKLTLKVVDREGNNGTVRDWLTFTSAFSLEKVLSFCETLCIEDLYHQGKLDALNLMNKVGFCELFEKEDKVNNKKYINIKEYIKGNSPGVANTEWNEAALKVETNQNTTSFQPDNDIPF